MDLKAFFDKEKIEYFSVVAYEELRVVRPYIIERESFFPRSAIIYLIPYFYKNGENISAYAVSRDYHIYLRELNERLANALSIAFPEAHMKGYGDHSPIDERCAAAICGLGCIGKNGLLINEKYGSLVFIGELITDIPPNILGAENPIPIQSCENCGACLAACPTGALSGLGECLSNITQRKGTLSENELELMRKCNTVWGCDICQAACPHNKAPIQTPISFFCEQVITSLTDESLKRMTDEEFAIRAYSWRGRRILERNLNNK